MYITREADYAARIVFCLAKAGERRDARSISEEVFVTLRFSLKILGKLSSAGIVNSYKGNRGGYELARPANQISVRDVLEAVDGPYSISRCIGEDACDCALHDSKGVCAFQNAFGRINDEINRHLGTLDFKYMIEEETLLETQRA